MVGPNLRFFVLVSNQDIRSARLYGQFSLDKMWTLQAGSSVVNNLRAIESQPRDSAGASVYAFLSLHTAADLSMGFFATACTSFAQCERRNAQALHYIILHP